jgi:hypothetical protein
MIKAYLKGQQRNWDLNLGCLAAAYRASPHEGTGMTPNLLMLGREVRLPAEIMFGSMTSCLGEEVSTYGDYVEMLKERMQHAHDIAREHLKKSAERQESHCDAQISLNKYKPGDYVWYATARSQLEVTPKLRIAFEGPFLVTRKLSDLDYCIQLNASGSQKIVHHNALEPYRGDQILKWAKAALMNAKKPESSQHVT